MRIVLDLQSAQAENDSGEGGQSSLLLAQAIVRNRGEHEVILALSGFFKNTIGPIRAAFDDLLPQENIRIWYSIDPVCERDLGNTWRREVAERIREAFLTSLRPDVVVIQNLFTGGHNNYVSSIGDFAKNIKTVVVVNNLDSVLNKNTDNHWHPHTLHKLEYLKSAELLVVLPPLTVDKVCQCLKVAKERVRTVGEAEADLKSEYIAANGLLHILQEIATAPLPSIRMPPSQRSKLAYVSPLPPVRSGIADYSAELLQALSGHYDIDVIVSQEEISTPWVIANCGVRTVDFFLQNSDQYSRVLYHFGNSSYHQHMFDLLSKVPGIVVLHDFYLGDVQYYLEVHAISPHALARSLYKAHGYGAVAERFRNNQIADVVAKYPTNLEILQLAQGVIVHSEYSKYLANQWYAHEFSVDWSVIPLLRTPNLDIDRTQAKQKLGFNSEDFIVCSFGLLGAPKLNHRLLEAWINSLLAKDSHCCLVFVGEEHWGEYGTKLMKAINGSGVGHRIRVTGWTDVSVFREYLVAADIAVQLRTLSRGETSAAVLDCMNSALPTIVNAHGSFSELSPDAVWLLPEIFEDCQLIEAMETLWQDSDRRAAIGKRAQEIIHSRHSPSVCAEQYYEAIEKSYATAQSSSEELISSITKIEGHQLSEAELVPLAQSVSDALPMRRAVRQLLVDISATCRSDLKTGIQRVVRALVWETLHYPPSGYRVEPIYLTNEGGGWHYRYAREWTSRALGFSDGWIADEPVEYSPGDVVLIADFTSAFAVEAERANVFEKLKCDGIALHFLVYDLLPMQNPEFFPPGQFGYIEWLETISRVADSAICISQSVADDLRSWVKISSYTSRARPINIDWFHLGADIESSIPSRGITNNAKKNLAILNASPSFLMVGTIEPRKGYLQTLEAFTQLWRVGLDINLVIVGKEGWQGLPDDMRRTIPKIIDRLRNHPELGKRLLWLEGISDEYLEKIYAASTCLIAASEGEGFGLPLIEAAQHKLNIIARDIPIFREVAGKHAYYFSGLEPRQLADAIVVWLNLRRSNEDPSSCSMPWLTWKQSAAMLMTSILPRSDGVCCRWRERKF